MPKVSPQYIKFMFRFPLAHNKLRSSYMIQGSCREVMAKYCNFLPYKKKILCKTERMEINCFPFTSIMQQPLAWHPHVSVYTAQRHIFKGLKIVYQVCDSFSKEQVTEILCLFSQTPELPRGHSRVGEQSWFSVTSYTLKNHVSFYSSSMQILWVPAADISHRSHNWNLASTKYICIYFKK